MVTKKYTDFPQDSRRRVLHWTEVSDTEDYDESNDICTRTHEDEWTISGEMYDDCFMWVEDFEAHHPIYGRVYGNFRNTVIADTRKGFNNFMKNHSPIIIDMDDR